MTQPPQPEQPPQPAQPSMPDFRPKSKTPLFAAGGGGLVVGALVTAAVMTATRPSPKRHPHVAVKPPASASAAPKPSASAPPAGSGTPAPLGPKPGSLAAKAEQGDADAIKTLEARPRTERTAEESVALSHAQGAAKRKAIAELMHKIELVPKLADSKDTMKQLREWADDGEVAADLALALGDLPGTLGPDLLYQLGPGYYHKVVMRDIAEDVLYSKDIRKKASPALGVILDLRSEDKCEDVKKTLDKVKVVGDRRSIPQLAKLQSKFGCGPKKTDDCWPCLRDGSILKDAIKEAAKRRGP